jgi:hypothetical protein
VLLRFYGENAETDNEDEYSQSARNRRVLAQKIGITASQITMAQISL